MFVCIFFFSLFKVLIKQNLDYKDELEDIKGVIRIRKSKKNRQHNGQKKKYIRTNNDRVILNPTTNRRWTQVFRKQFLLH